MTIRSILLIFGAILWLAAAGCWWRGRGDWRLPREGWLFLLLGAPFFVAGAFFTSSSYPHEQPSPTPEPPPVLVVATPAPRPAPDPPRTPAFKAKTHAEAVTVAQHAAVARYPDLGRAGTDFNARFVAAYRRLRLADPEFFTDPEWPLRLADDIARTPAEQP